MPSLLEGQEKKKRIIIDHVETDREKKKARGREILFFKLPKKDKSGDENKILSERMGS